SAPPEPLDEVREGPALCERDPGPHRKEVRLLGSPHEPLRVGDPLHESPLPRRRGGSGEGLRREESSMMTGGYRPGYVPGKVKMSVYVDPLVHRALRMRAAEAGVSMGEIVERYVRDDIRMAKYLRFSPDEFAQAMGFGSYDELARASETIVTTGDVGWYVTALPDGRWAAWDESELSLDRVAYFESR